LFGTWRSGICTEQETSGAKSLFCAAASLSCGDAHQPDGFLTVCTLHHAVDSFSPTRQVKGVKVEMSGIRSLMNEVKELQKKIITEVSAQRSKEYTEKLDNLLHQTSRKAKIVKEHLNKIKQEGEETFGEKKESSEARTHANMQGALTRKFVEIMGEFQEIQSNYKKHLRDRVARQVRLPHGPAPPPHKSALDHRFIPSRCALRCRDATRDPCPTGQGGESCRD
jgi:hypothetical protein